MANTPASDSRTVANSKCDSLGKLPVEVRKRIYGYYFADINEAQWFLNPAPDSRTLWYTRPLPDTGTSLAVLKAHLHILLAIHQVRAEAGLVLYTQYLDEAEFLFNINYYNGAKNFRCIQAICRSFAAFVTNPKSIRFGIQISTNATDKLLLSDLAGRMHRHTAWSLQRKAFLHYKLEYTDGRIDIDKLTKFGLSAGQTAFLAHNLEEIPSRAELDPNSAEHRIWPVIPGIKVQYFKGSFRIFGPLATIDWDDFDYEDASEHLALTNGYDDFVNGYDHFVHEVQDDGGDTMFDSDGEQEETTFYDTLELESDEGGDRTEDTLWDEYDDPDALDDGDEVDYEGSDFKDAAIQESHSGQRSRSDRPSPDVQLQVSPGNIN